MAQIGLLSSQITDLRIAFGPLHRLDLDSSASIWYKNMKQNKNVHKLQGYNLYNKIEKFSKISLFLSMDLLEETVDQSETFVFSKSACCI